MIHLRCSGLHSDLPHSKGLCDTAQSKQGSEVRTELLTNLVVNVGVCVSLNKQSEALIVLALLAQESIQLRTSEWLLLAPFF